MRKYRTTIALLIGIFIIINITITAQAATILAASNSSVNYTENDDIYIDPGLTITGSETPYSKAKVYIASGYVQNQDYLRYTTTNGISGSFDSNTGILTLTGSGTAAVYQEAFRNVRYWNNNEDPNTADRTITFVLGENTLYYESTGHYYEFVTSSAINWNTAKSQAELRRLEGMQGYLATITSAAENSFISSKITGQAWIGASDADVEGQWKWATGPEAGTQFWSGLSTGSVVGGQYNNWASGEPNNAGDEDYAHLLSNGQWNDYPVSLGSIAGYFVEYGGMAGDPSPQLTATVTVNITAVNDAPTTPGAFTTPTSAQVLNGSSAITVGWGASTDPAEGDAVKYDLWFFNGTWAKIGNLLTSNSMSYTLPQDDTESAMFRVYANDTMDNSSARDVTFTIDSSAPVYSWIQKILNASTGETVTVEINLTDVAGVDWCNVTVDGQEHAMTESSGNYTYNISIPASNSGTLVSSMTYNCSFADIFGHANYTGDVLMNVSILPIADFAASVTRGISPLSVNFTDNSSGLVENWAWDFGNGNNSTNQNTTHEFTSGNYTVALNVSNGNGTSISYINVRCADEPEYTRSTNSSELTSAYGEEQNFTLESTLYSSFEWFINGAAANSTGITLFNNTNDSEMLSYCLINSSQYINQSDFFMDIYNVSVQASNESIGRTDTHYWLWTITNSSAGGEDIEILVNVTPTVTINGSEKYLAFNTTNNNDTDDNGLACSITGASFNTTNVTTGIEIKVEVLNVSSINQSSIDFSASSIYQYLDISFNNETLVNNDSDSRNLEFRVLNEKDEGTLIINTVYLRHWDSTQWEAYTPELAGNDGTYSYFIVRNVSGFSPFAVTCNYQFSSASSTSDGMSVYLKKMLFWNDEEKVEENVETETVDIINSETSDNSDSSGITDGLVDSTALESEEILLVQEDNNKFPLFGILALLIVAGFFIILMKKKSDENEKQL